LTEKRSYDAIIVGGGVIGLSCAWRLAQAGGTVVVLDREQPPAGATRVAAGMLAPVGELTFGEPELLELTLVASELYPGFVAELEQATGLATGYETGGALHVALDRDEAAQLRRVHDLQRSLGLAAEWLAPDACRELEPGLTPSLAGGVHAPGEGSIDPRALTVALLAALHGEGVEVRSGEEVIGSLLDGGRIGGVRTASGAELRGATVVLAAGAWSGRAGWLPEPARPAVRPVKGQILELRPAGGAVAPCGRILASERVYLVPRPDGRLIVGATVEERGFDTAVTAGGVHELLREAYRLLPEVAEMELAEAMAALRPGTPDNLPLAGPGALDGLILASGHYRNGILLAPLAAARVVEAIAPPTLSSRLVADSAKRELAGRETA
jgi:glycine oxidase